ncbi:histidine phosphatase family protein [Polyangium jinanense]|uniref:Histidine phosphatase family protein n=1 Tax=Polyangium jinanense TaxID=2829994 RepID=A0A9X3WWX6_9BACT|nr:histidine phosphatase family protein [Polyangium jinanense]MDC3953185.1 histidine phosphatase family protein [Polyangium jinanense]MDC3979694.1 histidine phosphatase family protein [Polyangium jinanense]
MHIELIIVRHGQSEGNRDRVFTGHGPSPLTDRGRREAEAVARRITEKPVTAIFASDLPRALETAAPLVEKSGVPLVADPALRERNFGDLTGTSFADIEARHPDVWRALLARDPLFRPPGGESNADCRARISGFVEGLFARGVEGRIVLVSHGVAINQLLYHLLGVPASQPPPVVFRVDNCSVQRVERHEDTVRILCINDRSHLEGLT